MMERLSINLKNPYQKALARVIDITEESKIDAVSHALMIYAIICEAQAKGGAVYIQHEKDAPLERMLVI